MGTRGIQEPYASDLLDQILQDQAELQAQIDDLQAARPVLMQRARTADVTVPQEGQMVVEPDAETVKYHSNREWRDLGATPHWMVVWDNFIQGMLVGNQDPGGQGWGSGYQKIYWNEGTQSAGSEDIFDVQIAASPGFLGWDQIAIPRIKVDGIFTFTLSVHWDAASRTRYTYTYALRSGQGFPSTSNQLQWPGMTGTGNPLERRTEVDKVGYNDAKFFDSWSVTIPVHWRTSGPATTFPAEVAYQLFSQAQYNSENWQNIIYSRLFVTYHGPLKLGNLTDWF